MSRVVVIAQGPASKDWAVQLASDLNLPLLSSAYETTEYSLALEVGLGGLALVPTDPNMGKRLQIDFVSGPTALRRLAQGSARQPLAKAVGIRLGCRSVIDATAGLGRDSFLLACLGCRLTAIERSPVLAVMLADALKQAKKTNNARLKEITERIAVIASESKSFLSSLPAFQRPDVVYLDPMYTLRESSALAKKEMRILRMLVGGDDDAGELLRIARETAKKRVVVKRHLRAPPLANDVSVSYPGRAVRYDVYLIPPS